MEFMRLNQIKSNDGFVVHSIQIKQRPAAHYNNKIHVDKTLSSLMFTMKCTAKKISLQLSFESSGGNSLSQ